MFSVCFFCTALHEPSPPCSPARVASSVIGPCAWFSQCLGPAATGGGIEGHVNVTVSEAVLCRAWNEIWQSFRALPFLTWAFHSTWALYKTPAYVMITSGPPPTTQTLFYINYLGVRSKAVHSSPCGNNIFPTRLMLLVLKQIIIAVMGNWIALLIQTNPMDHATISRLLHVVCMYYICIIGQAHCMHTFIPELKWQSHHLCFWKINGFCSLITGGDRRAAGIVCWHRRTISSSTFHCRKSLL